MFNEIKKEISSARILIWLLTFAVFIYLFQIVWQVLGNFSDIIAIVIFAWIISFLLDVPVENLKNVLHVNKLTSALIVYLIFIGLVILTVINFIPSLTTQFSSLAKVIPQFLKTYPFISIRVQDFVNSSLKNIIDSLPSVANFLFSSFIAIIISFYLVIDRENIDREVIKLIPTDWKDDVRYIRNVFNSTFASFFRVQVLIGIICGFITWIILNLFSVGFAASTSVLSGVLNIIPFIGPILGIIPPILVSLATNPQAAIWITVVLIIIYQVIYNIISPRLLGQAFKIHPIIVLLAFFIGGQLAGATGAVLAIPVLGAIILIFHKILARFIEK